MEELSPEDQAKLHALKQDIADLRSASCSACGVLLCSHQAVIALTMGFKTGARCVDCIATGLGRARDEFLNHVHQHISNRPCFHAGWHYAGDVEGLGPVEFPKSLWKEQSEIEGSPISEAKHNRKLQPPQTFDAGDMGCGDLVLELRLRLKEMQAGTILEVRATDPGAPEDIPAWCRLTGHTLVKAVHPQYTIQRKEE